ncbi:MAG: hypothetical protein ACD_5C00345G0001 [uncultured bacterium]|nr:MAG: hypothetical protein ACD_5C00345G0001 [uncultured bacterium]
MAISIKGGSMFKSAVVLFVAIALSFIAPQSVRAEKPVTMNEEGESYLFFMDKTLKTSDTGITVKILVVAAPGVTLVSSGSRENGPVYMPTYIRMEVAGKAYSGSASVIDGPPPYILYSMDEKEYQELEGKILDVVFRVYERPIATRIKFLAVEGI